MAFEFDTVTITFMDPETEDSYDAGDDHKWRQVYAEVDKCWFKINTKI